MAVNTGLEGLECRWCGHPRWAHKSHYSALNKGDCIAPNCECAQFQYPGVAGFFIGVGLAVALLALWVWALRNPETVVGAMRMIIADICKGQC